jgi:hypothetical protein
MHCPWHLLYPEDYAAGNAVSESSEVTVVLGVLSFI